MIRKISCIDSMSYKAVTQVVYKAGELGQARKQDVNCRRVE